MAEVRITDLLNYPTVLSANTDVLPIVDVTNNVTKKITVSALVSGISGGGISSIGLNVPATFSVTPPTLTANGSFTLAWSTGQIPLNNIGTGTPTVNTYLRGDGAWSGVTQTLITNTPSATAFNLSGAITAGTPVFSVIGDARSLFPSGTRVSFSNDPSGFVIYTTTGIPVFSSGVTDTTLTFAPTVTVPTGGVVSTVTSANSTFNTIQAGPGITITNNAGVLTISRT